MSSENSRATSSADDAEEDEHVGIKVTSETEDGVQEEESTKTTQYLMKMPISMFDPVDDLDIDDVEAVDDEDETKSGESSGDEKEDPLMEKTKSH